jgi:ubiquinone biosynthesis protein
LLLQKTLLNIEGLGRQLDPDLDLWKTAKPFLERWMYEQVGWQGAWERSRSRRRNGRRCCPTFRGWPTSSWSAALQNNEGQERLLAQLVVEQRRTNRRCPQPCC